MPIYTRETLQTEKLPWVEIDDFEFHVLGRTMGAHTHSPDEPAPTYVSHWGTYQDAPLPTSVHFDRTAKSDRLIVLGGEVQVESEYGRITLKRRDWFDVPPGGATVINFGTTQAEIARVAGHWSQTIRTEICFFEPGHPCDYHYHDGDEYWIVFRGHFTLDYAGGKYEMKPGQMMAAGKGFEHGSLDPEEHFQAIVFAMALEGEKRDGHLSRQRDGAPTPGREVPESALQAFQLQTA